MSDINSAVDYSPSPQQVPVEAHPNAAPTPAESSTPKAEEPKPKRKIPKLLSRYLSKEMPPSGIMKALVGTRCACIRTLVIVASVSFLPMATLFVLAANGIYVSFFYDLLAPYWQPWMGSAELRLISFGVPIVLVAIWYRLCSGREEPEEEKVSEARPEEPQKDDSMDKALDEGLDEGLADEGA